MGRGEDPLFLLTMTTSALTYIITDDTVCANCSKAESDDIKLKRCTACKIVRYCSRDCQVAHRPRHKKVCKKRLVELFEEDLFKEHPERPECPICMLPLPFDESHRVFHSCCGKLLCSGCVHAKRKEDVRSGKEWKDCGACAFCRTPSSTTGKQIIDQLKRGIDRNDAPSMEQLATKYMNGKVDCSGRIEFQKDLEKAKELYQKAGELGYAEAYGWLGMIYNGYDGREKDAKKAKHYWTLGAIGGNLYARYNLAVLDWTSGNFSRACKHSLINVGAGSTISLKHVKQGLKQGYVTKDEYAEALRAYQKQHDETRSVMRDEAVVYKANPSLYFGNS